VPRFYLERFARGQRIAVVDRHTGARRVSPIHDTAAEKDFYNFINHDGDRDGRLEQLLGKIEGDAARVMRNLTSVFTPSPSFDDRAAPGLLLAFQLARGRTARRTIERFADMFMQLQLSFVKDEASARSVLEQQDKPDPSAEDVRELLASCAGLDDVEFVPDPNEHLRQVGNNAKAILPHLMARPWHLVAFSDRCC
jgi:hypothetical protein